MTTTINDINLSYQRMMLNENDTNKTKEKYYTQYNKVCKLIDEIKTGMGIHKNLFEKNPSNEDMIEILIHLEKQLRQGKLDLVKNI